MEIWPVCMSEKIVEILERAIEARGALLDEKHELALRLFNGFYEGEPRLVVDLFGHTLVLYNYATKINEGAHVVDAAWQYLQKKLPWVQCVIVKTRSAQTPAARKGICLHGNIPDQWIREEGIRYALELQMNRDASFYLDTRALRSWAKSNLAGKRVLNTFAYTGSLGVAAMAAGASQVVHLDLNRRFLNVAKTSYTLNGFAIDRKDFRQGDFWPQVSQLKRKGDLFDCVFLDPPFFSQTSKGRVDLVKNSQRLINKVRPLIRDGGILAAVNNAIFLAGEEYFRMLQSLCTDGYMQILELIPVPQDITGLKATIVTQPPLDPAPFNHPTKIALLRVRRKPARQDSAKQV